MSSPWITILIRPAEASSVMLQDDENPALAVIPVLAGISIAFCWAAAFHKLMTLPTQVGFALLIGPPAAMVSTWWWRICVNAMAKLLGSKPQKGALISIIAWSWLPLLYLSLVALLFTRGSKGAEIALGLQMIAIVWQLVIIGAALRATLSISILRVLSVLLLAVLVYAATSFAAGFGVSTLFNDLFSMAGVL